MIASFGKSVVRVSVGGAISPTKFGIGVFVAALVSVKRSEWRKSGISMSGTLISRMGVTLESPRQKFKIF